MLKKITRVVFAGYIFFIPVKFPAVIFNRLYNAFFPSISSSPFEAFLNSLMPCPIPFINSGIFLPPKSSTIPTIIRIISVAPKAAKTYSGVILLKINSVQSYK